MKKNIQHIFGTFSDALLCLSILFVLVFVFFIGNIIAESNLRNQLSQGFYSDKAIRFNTKDDNNDVGLIINKINNGILYKTNLDLNNDIRFVYIKGTINPPPMVDGKFLDEFSRNNCAVVGKKRLDDCLYIGNKYYYEFDGEQYEVIGVMGASFDSMIDRSIFIKKTKLVDLKGVFVLDQSDITQDILQSFANINIMEMNNNGLKRFFRKELLNLTFYGIAMLLVILSLIIVFENWIEKRVKQIGIMQMLGLKKKHIYISFYKRLFKYILFGDLLFVLIIILYVNRFPVYISPFTILLIIFSPIFIIALLAYIQIHKKMLILPIYNISGRGM
ncbi:MAG: hypothetical protein GX815_06810 [Clostridiales bacterium]|nr:hypothetical protein [Clostridiales bacterium]